MAHAVWLGLGTNLGDRAGNLAAAIAALGPLVTLDGVSGVYETDPVGHLDQPRFWNMVVQGRTDLAPGVLLHELKRLEQGLGRVPSFRMGPRLIDIDILLYDAILAATPELALPHPGLAARAFVLVPLLELAPGLVHPATGRPLAELPAAAATHGVRRLGDAHRVLPSMRKEEGGIG